MNDNHTPTEQVILDNTPEPQPLTMLDIYSRAVDRGFDAEQLERIARLQMWLKDKEDEQSYSVDMNNCQTEMQTVFRDHDNEATGKKYAPIETIQAVAKPVYTKHGFALSFGTIKTDVAGVYHVYVDVMHKRGHSKRHLLHDVPNDALGPKGSANKTQIQGLVSATTYAERKLLSMVFNITIAGLDKDGNQAGLKVFLGDAEVQLLQDKIAECNAAGRPVDHQKFMAYAAPGKKLFKEIPLKRLDLLLSFLQRRLNEPTQPEAPQQ